MSTATMSLEKKTLPEEFERLYREHATFVYRTALRITRNDEEAEDVLQTIFLRLLRSESAPDLQNRPRAYFYRAAVNTALDAIELRRNRSDSADLSEIEATLHSPDSSAKETLYQQLHKAISELNPTSAEIVVLRYMHNYSDAEIAKMLGKSRGVVAVTLYRARARLKKLIRRSQETRHETSRS
jgi:RNA polymerase sigma-70 factor (ECF subfamily)